MTYTNTQTFPATVTFENICFEVVFLASRAVEPELKFLAPAPGI